jgi:hypothetical protein
MSSHQLGGENKRALAAPKAKAGSRRLRAEIIFRIAPAAFRQATSNLPTNYCSKSLNNVSYATFDAVVSTVGSPPELTKESPAALCTNFTEPSKNNTSNPLAGKCANVS